MRQKYTPLATVTPPSSVPIQVARQDAQGRECRLNVRFTRPNGHKSLGLALEGRGRVQEAASCSITAAGQRGPEPLVG